MLDINIVNLKLNNNKLKKGVYCGRNCRSKKGFKAMEESAGR